MNDFKQVIPVRNCEYEINDNLVTVLYVNRKPSFIERIFFKKLSKKPYKIDLDEVGSFIWQELDGKKNIDEIIKIAEENFLEKIEPADERVELFIKQMHKNKLISLYEKK